jgi:UDP:flavonoid glycosyltransferase YjiC (YdhE family)
VYATFGTEFGAIAPWGPVLEALGVLDVDALVTTGPPGLPSDVQVPPNVVVERYVDQREVFGRAAAVVSHGGSGTLLGAAMAGVPQVCIPIGADQFENAAAVAARGIGVVVDPDRRHVSAIVDAVQRSTSDPSVASASAEVAAELAAAPDLREAADWIEGLVVTTSNA